MGTQGHPLVSVNEKVPSYVWGCVLMNTSYVCDHSDFQLHPGNRGKGWKGTGCREWKTSSHETSKRQQPGSHCDFSPSFNIQDQRCPPIPGPTENPSRIYIHTAEHDAAQNIVASSKPPPRNALQTKPYPTRHAVLGSGEKQTRGSSPKTFS